MIRPSLRCHLRFFHRRLSLRLSPLPRPRPPSRENYRPSRRRCAGFLLVAAAGYDERAYRPALAEAYLSPPFPSSPSLLLGRGSVAAFASKSSSAAADIMSPASPPQPSSSMISVSDEYDGGNGEFVSTAVVSDDGEGETIVVTVRIRSDPYTELEDANHFQYFSFRAAPTADFHQKSPAPKVRYVIENAGDAAFAPAWEGSTVFFTDSSDPFHDDESWGRKLDTSYDAATGRLSWTHVHGGEDSGAYFAYFPPYSYKRHLGLVQRCVEKAGDCEVRSLGRTVDGREIECVTVGTGPRVCWIIHRQHPGESMAEFYAEGLLERLLGMGGTDNNNDAAARRAREMYTFHVVPSMNPDGALRGYLRTNAAGSNLNREWAPSSYVPASADDGGREGTPPVHYEAPTLERSPEVLSVLRRMDETGCDAFLDVHGDEALPFNFLAGSEGTSVWSPRLEGLHGAFLASYVRSNPDMQSRVSYEPDEPLLGKTNICSNQIATRFDCFAATLEMPFKDCLTNPDPERGWSPGKSKRLGASVLDALCYVHPYLRTEDKFWGDFSKEDAYVRPSEKY